jgi:hypothetical protein
MMGCGGVLLHMVVFAGVLVHMVDCGAVLSFLFIHAELHFHLVMLSQVIQLPTSLQTKQGSFLTKIILLTAVLTGLSPCLTKSIYMVVCCGICCFMSNVVSSKHVSIRESLLSIFVSMTSIWYAFGIGGSACLLQNSKLRRIFIAIFVFSQFQNKERMSKPGIIKASTAQL